jgi:hypothetical protein
MRQLLQQLSDSMTIRSFTKNDPPPPEPPILLQATEKTRTLIAPDLILTESYSKVFVDRVSAGIVPIILGPNALITRDDCVRRRASAAHRHRLHQPRRDQRLL